VYPKRAITPDATFKSGAASKTSWQKTRRAKQRGGACGAPVERLREQPGDTTSFTKWI